MLKSIAVFCGSQAGNNPLFVQQATLIGSYLANNGIPLVYGGGNVGLMGAIANAVMQQGGKAIGIMPTILKEREHHHTGISELHVVQDMHERKKMMYQLCDAAIILPGGAGTMDELFEMYTWNNLKIHHKPILILNTAGFYNMLIAHLDAMTDAGFMYGDWKERIHIFENAQDLISFLDSNKNYSQPE